MPTTAVSSQSVRAVFARPTVDGVDAAPLGAPFVSGSLSPGIVSPRGSPIQPLHQVLFDLACVCSMVYASLWYASHL
jgi:hypothetical protein